MDNYNISDDGKCGTGPVSIIFLLILGLVIIGLIVSMVCICLRGNQNKNEVVIPKTNSLSFYE